MSLLVTTRRFLFAGIFATGAMAFTIASASQDSAACKNHCAPLDYLKPGKIVAQKTNLHRLLP